MMRESVGIERQGILPRTDGASEVVSPIFKNSIFQIAENYVHEDLPHLYSPPLLGTLNFDLPDRFSFRDGDAAGYDITDLAVVKWIVHILDLNAAGINRIIQSHVLQLGLVQTDIHCVEVIS